VQLSLDNSGSLSGSDAGSTVNGCVDFSGLKVSSPGVFVLTATNQYSYPFSYSSLTINSLTITITSDYDPTSFFDHSLSIEIRDYQSNLYIHSLQVTLSASNSIITTNPLTTSSGSCSFSLYFTQSGQIQISASSLGYTGQLSLTVNKPILKLSMIPPSVLFT
jgi:hypothetical protein